MRNLFVLAATLAASCAAFGQTTIGDPPVRSAVVPTQRVGDLVVRGSIAPSWHVPNESKGAMLTVTSPSNIPPVPTRAGTEPAVQTPLRLNSQEWRERIDFLDGQIQAKQRELTEAKASEMVAIQSEQREAEEQIRRSQALVEQLRAKQVTQVVVPVIPVIAKAVEVERAPNETIVASVKVTPTAAPPNESVETAQVFQLRRDDRTIATALTRWAEEASYSLLWEIEDKPASFNAKYTKSFPDAVYEVIQGLNAAGVDARMCNYTNRVVRIVTKDIGCVMTPGHAKINKTGA